MAKTAKSVETDAELTRQLKSADKNEPVEVVIRLRSEKPSEIVPSPDRTEQLTKKVLKRVKENTGGSVNRYNVFRNLGYAVVSADADVVRDLIKQPEIASAAANNQPGEIVAKPVRKSAVSSKSKNRPAPKSTSVTSRKKPLATPKKGKGK